MPRWKFSLYALLIGRRSAASDASSSRALEDLALSHDLAPALPSVETVNPKTLFAVGCPTSNHSTNAAKMRAHTHGTVGIMETHDSSQRLEAVDLPLRSWANEECSGFSYSEMNKGNETFSRLDSSLCTTSNLLGINTENDNNDDYMVENEILIHYVCNAHFHWL